MVSRTQAKRYCKEDISLIENYEQASKDLLETWDLHHRKEDEGYSYKELIDLGFYYKRPASELIFLTHAEHKSLHSKGNKYRLGKKHSEEARRKMSEAQKGEKSYLYGKTGDSHHLSKPVNQIDKQTGEIIKTWPCVNEVQRVLGISKGNISQCCTGKYKSVGGYIWRYV